MSTRRARLQILPRKVTIIKEGKGKLEEVAKNISSGKYFVGSFYDLVDLVDDKTRKFLYLIQDEADNDYGLTVMKFADEYIILISEAEHPALWDFEETTYSIESKYFDRREVPRKIYSMSGEDNIIISENLLTFADNISNEDTIRNIVTFEFSFDINFTAEEEDNIYEYTDFIPEEENYYNLFNYSISDKTGVRVSEWR